MASEAERQELEHVLTSGVVDPDSNQGKLLRYVFEKHFDGTADLKERNIAIDVFHRPASFDKRSDSIVRVEAYRLRKRLLDYYAGHGRDRPLRIAIPLGQYAPTLETNIPPHPNTPELVEPEDSSRDDVEPSAPARWSWSWTMLVAAAALIIGSAGAWSIRSRQAPRAPVVASSERFIPESTPVAAEGDAIRILPGYIKERYVDRRGHVWLGDRYYHGGESFDDGPGLIARAFDPALFQSRRDGQEFTYDIPARPGKYELKLFFSEFHFGTKLNPGGENSRVMDVYLNGSLVLHFFDIYAEAAGSQVGHIRAFRDVSPARDGMVHIRFMGLYDRALVNAIELVPQPSFGIRPIRMLARLSSFVDKQGALWVPDDYVVGGQFIVRNVLPYEAIDPELYQGERFGHFNYAIPVPPGRYRVSLYFDEAWFKQPGARVFNVFTDGKTLLHDFDIVREAGGQLHPVIRAFHNLEPNAQGLLNLSFVPVVNYPLVNAIEVSSE